MSSVEASPVEALVNVAVREGEVLVMGLTREPLTLSAQTAERLAQRLMDAVAVAKGQHPGRALG
ncbi:MAG: hypothetical protein JSR86_08060 [Proteobacteria bacterium]|nr:hypothetical protein [Pseudomonadota bacterium]